MESHEFSIDPELQAKIARKQAERQAQFADLKSKYSLNEKAQSILQLPVLELQKKLQSSQLSASDVLQAYLAKALDVNEKFNCITEFIPQCMEWAKSLDKKGVPVGPLHGLPVAIKDDHDIEGMDTTLGYSKNLYKPAKESAALVQALIKLGAVPFAKTNVPQTLCSSGSDNPIFGTTLNCLNVKLAPGGSSSGSGCFVAAGGAPFATGSDLGGSLRIPSHFHGISTVRPTGNRLSEKGVVQCLPEAIMPRGVPGIMAPNAKVLAFVWKALTETNIQNTFDPMAVPIPWNENLFSSSDKLRIGYFTSLPFFPTFKDTRDTVLAAKLALESKGHKLVEFQMPDDFHYMKVICDMFMGDQGKYMEKMFEGEPISDCIKGVADIVRSMKLGKYVDTTGWSERHKIMMGDWGVDLKTSGDLWNAMNEKRLLTLDILSRMEKVRVDLILSPTFPFPSVKLDAAYKFTGMVYTVIWNFVDFPAGVVKFGIETEKNVECYDDENDSVLKAAKEAMSESAGAPINVQIIGKPFKEELVLKALVELENLKK